MRKTAKLLAVTALALIAGCSQLEKHPFRPDVSRIDVNDPQSVAEGLFNKTISDSELVQVVAMPLEFNLRVATHIMRLRGYTESEAKEFVQGLRVEIEENSKRTAGTASIAGACSQPVEHKTVVRDPVWAYTYTTWTDSSRGQEWLYYFSPWWTVDSNNIRWAANDPIVFWGLYLAYGSISGSNLCSKPHRLLIGNKGMKLAGGPDLVLARLYIHHT